MKRSADGRYGRASLPPSASAPASAEGHEGPAGASLHFYLLCDDTGEPCFVPSWLFEPASCPIPQDWICTVGMGSGVDLVMGPALVARDLASYQAVVDHTPEAMYELLRRAQRP